MRKITFLTLALPLFVAQCVIPIWNLSAWNYRQSAEWKEAQAPVLLSFEGDQTSTRKNPRDLFHGAEEWVGRLQDEQVSLESDVLKCVGISGFNATCLFANLYTHEGTREIYAYVVQGSERAQRFSELPELHLYGSYNNKMFLPIVEFDSIDDLNAAAQLAKVFPGLTAAFESWWPHNIGHGIFDGIWHIFVGLVELGLKSDAPFNPYLYICDENEDAEKEFGSGHWGKRMVRETYEAVALGGSLSVCEPGRLGRRAASIGGKNRLELTALGSGHKGQRTMTASYELVGGRFALQPFRDRAFRGFGIETSDERPCLLEKKRPLKVVIFDNKRYSKEERNAIKSVVSQYQYSKVANVRFVDWRDFGTMSEQLRLVSETDIYVSSPGTGLALTTFLRDGAVVINLGAHMTNPGDIFPVPSYMEEYLQAGSPHTRALYYDRCAHQIIEAQELTKIIEEAIVKVDSCFDTSGRNYDSAENKSPVAKAFSQVMSRMTEDMESLPRYFYDALKVNECDWAELFVFESPSCRFIRSHYQWDSLKFSQVLNEARAANNLDLRQCTYRQQAQCDSRECVFDTIRPQFQNQPGCIKDGDGQSHKAVFNLERIFSDDEECVVFSGGISTDYLYDNYFEKDMAKRCKVFAFDCTVADENNKMKADGVDFAPVCIGGEGDRAIGFQYQKQVENEYKNSTSSATHKFKPLLALARERKIKRIDLLKIDIEGYEWKILEEDLVALWKEDESLLPDQIAFKLHTKYANAASVPPSVVENRGRDAVDSLFLLLAEMGYFVTAKDVNGGDPACAEFVVSRIKASTSSTLAERLNKNGCPLEVMWPW